MAYGLNPQLFLENGPANQVTRARSLSSTDGFRAWRTLHRETRLALVDRALRAVANDDCPDGYPLAL